MGTVVPGRELSQEQHPAELQLTPDDVHLTWRGDAKYFASCSRAQAGMLRAARPSPLAPRTLHRITPHRCCRMSQPCSLALQALQASSGRNQAHKGPLYLPMCWTYAE